MITEEVILYSEYIMYIGAIESENENNKKKY